MTANQRTNVLPQTIIKQLWRYEEGHLYWLISKPGITLGKKAGALNKNGYIRIGYMYKAYAAHNLIWIMHNGKIPDDLEIDHIDNNRNNNIISNLRLLSTQDNLLLRKHIAEPKGSVYFQKANKKWRVQITINNKRIELGLYNTKQMAVHVLNEYRISLGFDTNLNLLCDKLRDAGVMDNILDTDAQAA
jgi:hypothetical protein